MIENRRPKISLGTSKNTQPLIGLHCHTQIKNAAATHQQKKNGGQLIINRNKKISDGWNSQSNQHNQQSIISIRQPSVAGIQYIYHEFFLLEYSKLEVKNIIVSHHHKRLDNILFQSNSTRISLPSIENQ
jgi:hypothetical protein